MAEKGKEKEEEEKDEGEEAAAEPPKKKGKKKLFIIVAAVVLLGGGGAAFAFLGGGAKPAGQATEEFSEEEEDTHYATVELDPFIVNLSDNASFLKIRMLIEYDPKVLEEASAGGGGTGGGHGGGGYGGGGAGGGDKDGGLPGILGDKEPMIRDAIIRVLSSKKVEQVLAVEGKEELKEELVEAINEATGLDEQVVVGIYFTEFIVQ